MSNSVWPHGAGAGGCEGWQGGGGLLQLLSVFSNIPILSHHELNQIAQTGNSKTGGKPQTYLIGSYFRSLLNITLHSNPNSIKYFTQRIGERMIVMPCMIVLTTSTCNIKYRKYCCGLLFQQQEFECLAPHSYVFVLPTQVYDCYTEPAVVLGKIRSTTI